MKAPFRLPLVIALLLGSFSPAAGAQELVLQHARLYSSPTAAPLDDATVVIRDGKIIFAAKQRQPRVAKTAQVIDCTGKVIVAGFWNSHVHFETGWQDAAHAPATELEAHMHEMLTRWGFTTVWDLGSDLNNTLALRKRIGTGEIAGPQILMAGDIFPEHGHPVYLPPEMQLPEAATPAAAEQMAKNYMAMGLDGMKLFTGAFMGDKPVVNMDPAIAKAAADVAHAEHKPAFAHPQNRAGVDSALAGGVDVLAHTIPTEEGFSNDELARMKAQHTALIPTLTLWTTVVPDPAIQQRLVVAGVIELKIYFSQGGTILFGTDVGFQSKYDTTQEYEYMGRAMGWRDVLASLTTNPSAYFHQTEKGRVEPGMDADLVVLNADPAIDGKNLARVAYTIRAGKIIYSSEKK